MQRDYILKMIQLYINQMQMKESRDYNIDFRLKKQK